MKFITVMLFLLSLANLRAEIQGKELQFGDLKFKLPESEKFTKPLKKESKTKISGELIDAAGKKSLITVKRFAGGSSPSYLIKFTSQKKWRSAAQEVIMESVFLDSHKRGFVLLTIVDKAGDTYQITLSTFDEKKMKAWENEAKKVFPPTVQQRR